MSPSSAQHLEAAASRRWPALASFVASNVGRASMALLHSESHSQNGEDVALHAQFFARNTSGGTFVEMGALDGILLSNTLAYEKLLGWSGVLIDANPALCPSLVRNRPKARTLCTAVSANYTWIKFEKGLYTSTFGEVAEMDKFHRKFHKRPSRQHKVPSAPLGQLLRMAGLSSIDLFSLDVEGAELKVLQTHDWSLPVRVWCVETTDAHRPAVDALMASKGYRHERWLANGQFSFAGSDLWVYNRTWAPETYSWRQYAPQEEREESE